MRAASNGVNRSSPGSSRHRRAGASISQQLARFCKHEPHARHRNDAICYRAKQSFIRRGKPAEWIPPRDGSTPTPFWVIEGAGKMQDQKFRRSKNIGNKSRRGFYPSKKPFQGFSHETKNPSIN
jgi:hypothetical protein